MPKSDDDEHAKELRELPNAVGAEKSVLSCLLKEPDVHFPVCAEHGISGSSFYNPARAVLFSEMERLHQRQEIIELVSLIQILRDRGKLDAVGGPAEITEAYIYTPLPTYFARHAKMLRDKEVQRGMIGMCRATIEAIYDEPEATEEHLTRASETLRGLAAAAPGSRGSLWERARCLRYDPAMCPPGEEVCLLLGDIPVAARGNLTVVQGKSKVGKSAVVSAILGAALAVASPQPGDCLGFRWLQGAEEGEDGPGVILHLDTEQSPGDWHGLVTRSLVRAGLAGREDAVERLISLPLVTFSRAERLGVLRSALEEMRRQGRRVELVVIDGIADLCISPNDEAEGLELVSRILVLAHEFRVAISAVIHENPSTDMAKTRGHLGSELNRKAFANLRIDKDPATGISVIYGTDMRKRDIPHGHGFCFGWDEVAKMHVFKGRNSVMKTEIRERDAREKAREYWEEIFEAAGWTNGACPTVTVKQAIKVELDINGTGKPTAEATMRKRMQRAEIIGVLRKVADIGYVLAPVGPVGQPMDTADIVLA